MNQTVSAIATHPMYTQIPEIEERGVLVIDNVKGLPSFEEPYVSPYLVVVICHQGYSRGQYDMKPIEFRTHDFSIVYPGHSIMAFETSKDYCATLIVHSKNLYDKLRPRLAYTDSYVFQSQPCFHLSEAHYQCICDAVKLLKSVSCLELDIRKDLIVNIIDMISDLLNIFRQAKDEDPVLQTNTCKLEGRSLINQFYDLLALHYKDQHEVRFYAEHLCLSPKYFGSLIKKEMGISARRCIANYVVTQAKLLLGYHSELNIQQISHELGFDDPTSFSRYFKAVAGVTPTEFREGIE